MYLSYQQVAATAVLKGVAELTVPAKATLVEIQADTQNVRYTMDGSNPTQTVGMLFLTTEPPRQFTIDDLNRIRFIRGSGSDGNLNFHYLSGRDI